MSYGAGIRAEPDGSAPVTAEQVASCVARHDEARQLRLNEAWLEARAAMTSCAEPRCPIAIRSDCAAWLEELAAVLPSVLVVIERDDAGATPVTLEIDGQPRELPRETAPLELLPGPHVLRFTLAPYPPVVERVELAKGEKNRVVRVRFARAPASAEPASPPSPPSRVTEVPRAAPARPVPFVTYLSAAGALALLTTSGILLGSALASRDEAREECAPECRDGEREAIDQRLLAADIVGAAGLALGGIAVYTFVTRPSVPDAAEGRAAPKRPAFATVGIRGRF